jgi:hypothetical protein
MGKKTEFRQIVEYINNHVQNINNSKIFTGFMIVSLNIVSKFVNIKLSKTMEAYLKVSFSKYFLIFIIAWMGTRDIYIAIIVSFLGVFMIDYLFNEESCMCILPEQFKEHHLTVFENFENNSKLDEKNSKSMEDTIPDIITEKDISNAKLILEKAKKQRTI